MATKSKKPQKPKSDNPYNPTCSTTVQVCLDILKAGFPLQGTIEDYLELAKSNNDICIKAEQTFKEHQYPDDRLSFYQGSRNIQFECFLTVYELKILHLMYKNMSISNLIELSITDIKDYCDIADKAATKALNGLKDKGCIAVRCNRSKTRGTIFMVNPAIAVLGNVNKSALQYTFWCLTGSEYIDGTWTRSKSHEKWLRLTKDQKYTLEHISGELDKKPAKYSKLNKSDIKKDLPGGTDKPNNDTAQ